MRITLIGSGNVATHLAAAFKNSGHRITQVYSPNKHHAALLAYHVNAEAIDDLKDINAETDLFVIAVKDDAIATVVPQLTAFNKLMVHTAGAVPLQQLIAFTDKAGVFYPLQTFSKIKEVNFREVPLCIEGANDAISKMLEELARSISNRVYRVDTAQRKVLHLSAVFACNFTNHLYRVAQSLLAGHQLEFDMLRPLIAETAGKVIERLPAQVQTGPAVRNDERTMQAHLEMLTGQPALQQIYELLSQDIIKNTKAHNGDK